MLFLRHSFECFYAFSICCLHTPKYLLSAFIGSLVVLACSILSLFVAYIIIGVVYKRFFLGAKGAEQFPHVDHWRMCGNLIAVRLVVFSLFQYFYPSQLT